MAIWTATMNLRVVHLKHKVRDQVDIRNDGYHTVHVGEELQQEWVEQETGKTEWKPIEHVIRFTNDRYS